MRSKPLTLLFLAASALVFGMLTMGCKKHNSSPAPSPSQFSALVGDSAYPVGRSGILSYQLSDSQFAVVGEDTLNNTSLMVVFSAPFSLNVPFTTTTTGAIVAFTYNSTGTVFEARGDNYSHATITITSYDPGHVNIAGQFNGVLYGDQNVGEMDSIVVSAGSFNAYSPVN
jgi:hypothetical protein